MWCDVVHVAGCVDPLSDIETINTELALADLETTEKALDKANKLVKSGDKQVHQRIVLLERVIAQLNQGKAVRHLELDEQDKFLLQPLHLLTIKPMMYVANVNEDGFKNNPLLDQLNAFAAQEGSASLAVCAMLESEIADLSAGEKQEFLQELGLEESGLDRLIHVGYDLLGLQTYFTAGQKEVRAWTIHQGMTAPQAAGVIHGDFEKAFIRAEVISFDDFIRCQGIQGAKEAGVWRLEGKDYVVKNGDVMLFRSGL